jgi:two-component system response regulator HydG
MKAIQQALREAEMKVIEDALKEHQYNKTETAKALGVDRKTLYNKMNRYWPKKKAEVCQ